MEAATKTGGGIVSDIVKKVAFANYVLKIMHHLIQNGHPSFTEQLRKSDGSLKIATMYNGLPDPLLGSSPYEAVRKKAQV
uniref:Uncharacterized protein n=1 Tax=Timema poppense TaxID=170557 RepID=A0A7R9DSH1_TIMPO|nr:unnamed protein product [Timema poppensis]